jgi:hypothetical protein
LIAVRSVVGVELAERRVGQAIADEDDRRGVGTDLGSSISVR